MTQLAEHRYVFDNDSTHSNEQHRCLAAAYDGPSTARLAELGVAPGWHCLEIGAGGGSISRWLAERVGPSGTVLATDIKPQHIPEAVGLSVLRHDIVHEPLPERRFDLIYARLVLIHLAERRAVLDKLLCALKPGGYLQLDEFDISYGPVLRARDQASARLYDRFLDAKAAVMSAAGALPTWGREAGAALRATGFTEVDDRPRVELWQADSPGLHLLVHHTYHLRDALVEHGMTDAELAEVRAVMADPEFRACSCVFYSVHGRRPL